MTVDAKTGLKQELLKPPEAGGGQKRLLPYSLQRESGPWF